MSLVRDHKVNETNRIEAAIEKWDWFPASKLSHHNEICCRIAREWILDNDYSQLNGGSKLAGPRWIRQKYVWGPSVWEMHWCKAVEQKTLDCGALAAIAHEIFVARGVRSYPVQLVQQYTIDATRQWYKRWKGDESTIHWIKDDVIYHEGCAVATGEDTIKVWDASAGWWINPRQHAGYGSLLAIRVFAGENKSPQKFKWGNHQIAANQWQQIEKVETDFA